MVLMNGNELRGFDGPIRRRGQLISSFGPRGSALSPLARMVAPRPTTRVVHHFIPLKSRRSDQVVEPSSIPSGRRSAVFSGARYTPSFGISDVVTSVSPMRNPRRDDTPAVGQRAEASVQEVIDMRGCGYDEVRCRATPLEHLGLELPVHGSTLGPQDLLR